MVFMCRSCRARLAKRRSGTRALLQKKGCKDSILGSDQGAAPGKPSASAAAACANVDTSGLTPQQQLMLMYGQHSNEQLLSLLSDATVEHVATDTGSPQHCMPAPSLSDGAPMAAATAAAAAAAASNAAAAAAHQALSAPLYMLGGSGLSDAHRTHTAGADAAAAFGDEPMGQAEVLMALQAMEDSSDPLQGLNAEGLNGSATSAAGPGAAAAAAGAGAPPASACVCFAAEHASCSLPLAQLDLSSGGSLPKAVAPGSPMGSMGGAACKSAPLGSLHPGGGSGLLESLGLMPQRSKSTATAAFQQQQGTVGRSGSRLKWLIQELQQELDVCNPAELEALNNDELGTLLCAALAPTTSNAAAAALAAGAAGAVSAQAGRAQLSTGAPLQTETSNASMMSLMQTAQQGLGAGLNTAGFSADISAGFSPLQGHASEVDLQLQKAQVLQLQQKVHQLQLQLQVGGGKDGSAGGSAARQCATPPPTSAHPLSASAAAAGVAPGSADMPPAYRSMSGMSDAKVGGVPAAIQAQRAQLGSLIFGAGADATAPLPTLHSQPSAAAGNLAAVAARLNRPSTPGPMPAGMSMDMNASHLQWMTNMTNSAGMSQPLNLSRLQQAQQQQRLQQVQQQALNMQMAAASAGMQQQQQPDGTAAMQFMMLQNQLKMVEDEMIMLMAQQSATAR